MSERRALGVFLARTGLRLPRTGETPQLRAGVREPGPDAVRAVGLDGSPSAHHSNIIVRNRPVESH